MHTVVVLLANKCTKWLAGHGIPQIQWRGPNHITIRCCGSNPIDFVLCSGTGHLLQTPGGAVTARRSQACSLD